MLIKRIIAFYIDLFFQIVLLVLMSFLPFDEIECKFYHIVYVLILLIILSLYYTKDIVGGQSIGKRVMKIKVIVKGKSKSSICRLILRNITISIWPVEFIILLLGKEKLGDRLAGTEIIDVNVKCR